MKNYDVFISHKSQDKAFLTKVENFLNQKGYTYWSDTKLKPGIDWIEQIQTAISESKIMLVILSRNVINDPDNIESEIACATQYRLKYVVIKIDDTSIDDYDSGPFDLYLKKVQWINYTDDFDKISESLNLSLQMNLATKSKKNELNEQLQIELNKLAEQQKQEYEKNIEKKMFDSFVDFSVSRINALIDDGFYGQALTEINSQLKSSNNWKLYEAKIKCVTRSYTKNSLEANNILYELRKSDIPKDRLQTIERYMRFLTTGTNLPENNQSSSTYSTVTTPTSLSTDTSQTNTKVSQNKLTKYKFRQVFFFILGIILSTILIANFSLFEFPILTVAILALNLFIIFNNTFVKLIIYFILALLISGNINIYLENIHKTEIFSMLYSNYNEYIDIFDIFKEGLLQILPSSINITKATILTFSATFLLFFFILLISNFTKPKLKRRKIITKLFFFIIRLALCITVSYLVALGTIYIFYIVKDSEMAMNYYFIATLILLFFLRTLHTVRSEKREYKSLNAIHKAYNKVR